MSQRSIVRFAAVAAAIVAGQAMAEPVSSPEHDMVPNPGIESLSPDIRSVSSKGLWLHGSEEGWLRFVVVGGGVDQYNANLYVQWFKRAGDEGDVELVHSLLVEELGNDDALNLNGPAFAFRAPECEDTLPCTSAILEAFNQRTRESATFRILLDEGPGRYKLESLP